MKRLHSLELINILNICERVSCCFRVGRLFCKGCRNYDTVGKMTGIFHIFRVLLIIGQITSIVESVEEVASMNMDDKLSL